MSDNTGGKKGTKVAKAIVTVIPSMEGSRKEIESELSKAIVNAAKTAGEAGGKTLGETMSEGASSEIKEELPKSVKESAPEVKQAVKSTLESAVKNTVSAPVKDGVKSALTNAMSDVNESTKGTIDKLFSGNIVSTLKKSIPTGLTTGLENAKSVVNNSVDKVLDVGKGVANSVKSKLPEGMVTALSNAKGTITSAFDKVVGGGLKDTIKSKMPPAFTEALSNVKSAVKNTLGKIMSSSVVESLKTSVGSALRNGITSAKSVVKSGLQNLFHGGISEAVKSSLPNAFNDGLSTVKIALGNMLGNIFTSAIQTAFSSIKQTVSDAFYGFADFQQLEGGVETLFKDSADTVKANAADAFKNAGLSANEYMDTVTSFSASLISGLGGDTAKAAEVADLALKDMSDNANKMGTDISSIQMAYQGFAKDNYTLLDNLKLGYGGTQAEMARLVNEAGVMTDGFVADAKNINEVPFDKIIEAIHVVQDRMDITGTTAKEAEKTISGSIGMMKSSWQNFLTGMANPDADMSKLSRDLVYSFKKVLENALPAIKQMFKGAADGIVDVLSELGFQAASDFFKGFFEGLDNDVWTNAFDSIKDTFKIISEGFERLFGKLDGEAVAYAISNIGGAVILLSDSLGDLWPYIEQFIGSVKDTLGDLFGDVDAWELFKGLVLGVTDVMKTLFTVLSESIVPAIGNVLQTIGDGLGRVFGDVDGFVILKDIVNLVGEAFVFVLNTIAQLWPVIEPLINFVKEVGITAFDAFYKALTSEEAHNALESFIELLGNITGSLSDFLMSILPDSDEMAGVLETIFGVLDSIFTAINDNWPAISAVFDVIGGIVDTVFTNLWEILKQIGETISSVAGEVGKNLLPEFDDLAKISFDDIAQTIKDIADLIKDVVIDALKWIEDHGELIGAIIGGLANAFMITFTITAEVIKFIVETIQWVVDRIEEIGGALDNIASSIIPGLDAEGFNPLGLFTGMAFFAEGGIATQPSIAGEAGPELIWPEYNPYFDKYASGIASHLDNKAGGDTYFIIDGAKINASEEMTRNFYNNMMDLRRLGVMQSGYAQ